MLEFNNTDHNVADFTSIVAAWSNFTTTAGLPKNPQSLTIKQYDHFVTKLESLILHVNDFRIKKPLPKKWKDIIKDADSLIYNLTLILKDYEDKHFTYSEAKGHEVLKYLMDEHNLTQADLKEELGGQSVVSAILNRKRELNKKQIQALSERFNVSPAVFYD